MHTCASWRELLGGNIKTRSYALVPRTQAKSRRRLYSDYPGNCAAAETKDKGGEEETGS